MGFLELLTLIFILLKVFGQIDWSWWLVFLPTIVSFSFYSIWVLFAAVAYRKVKKQINEEFGE
ncbi:transmembrane Fragile-X-F protein [Bacillus sp. FSL K6-1284]|uniref:transmembrane Fragile-X-F protein n=1 Tax=Bacillus sp. FSL K6-1284 TaxID=2921468 RepID=UPI0030FCBAB9